MDNTYFVFGSNEQGIHGVGAALYAKRYHGARISVGEGFSGNSYAIPTKVDPYTARPFSQIAYSVELFIALAKVMPTDTFHLTKVGCGLAGIPEVVMAYLFVDAPTNVILISVDGHPICKASEWFSHVYQEDR